MLKYKQMSNRNQEKKCWLYEQQLGGSAWMFNARSEQNENKSSLIHAYLISNTSKSFFWINFWPWWFRCRWTNSTHHIDSSTYIIRTINESNFEYWSKYSERIKITLQNLHFTEKSGNWLKRTHFAFRRVNS